MNRLDSATGVESEEDRRLAQSGTDLQEAEGERSLGSLADSGQEETRASEANSCFVHKKKRIGEGSQSYTAVCSVWQRQTVNCHDAGSHCCLVFGRAIERFFDSTLGELPTILLALQHSTMIYQP